MRCSRRVRNWARPTRPWHTNGRTHLCLRERYARVALVGRAHQAKLIESFGEEIVEKPQLMDVFDHTKSSEVKLVNSIGKALAEPAFIVLDVKADARLDFDELAEAGIGQEAPHFRFIAALDDKRIVERRLADFDVLHAEPFADGGEHIGAIDSETEPIAIDVRGADARIARAGFAIRFGVDIQSHGPFADVGLESFA